MTRTLSGADVVAYRGRRNFSRKALAAETGLTEGKIWRIENKDHMSDQEEQALLMCGVTPVTMPADQPALPRVDAGIVVTDEISPEAHAAIDASNAATDEFLRIIDRQQVRVPDVDLGALHAEMTARKLFSRYFSNSEIQTFKRCRRKWWLAWYRGLRERRESPTGVRQVGNRLHRALQSHYVPGGPPSATYMLDELETLIAQDRAAAEAAGWMSNEKVAEKFAKEADLERIMLEGYIEWLAITGADADLKVIAPEAYLEAGLDEFGENVVAIIGKIDVRIRRITDGAILFLDHKSVAEFTSTTKLLNIQEQPIHYQLLETMLAPEGENVSGALWNMMRRVKRTPAANPPFYQRVEVRHNPKVLDNYRGRLVGEIQDILEVEENLNKWPAAHQRFAYPSPTRDCSWDCPFLQVCPMFDDGSRAEAMLDEHFIEGDPLSYYMTEVLGEGE
jgi:hypothetical protein